ncbi:MAG: hypothetical protein WD824_24660 [Cyclobacteriaceae bacterium]
MSKLVFLIGLLIWSVGVDQTNGSGIVDNNALLTGNNKKSWYLYSTTPDNSGECKDLESVKSDNSYIFSADGGFEFDHGTVTEDPSCEDCCSDFVNIVGQWKFTGNEKGIRVTLIHEKGKKENAHTMVLFDASIELLTEQGLKLRQTDKASGTVYTLEFRKR